MASINPNEAAAAAAQSLREAYDTLKGYAAQAQLSAEDGKLMDDLSDGIKKTADNMDTVKRYFNENGYTKNLPTDAVIDLVRSGLSQTAVLSSRVGVFDREHKLTARAAKGLKSALQSATDNISSVQGRIDDLRSGAASAVESAKVTAGAAADRVRGTVNDVVDGASQKAASVKSSLDRSVTDLGQSVTGMAGSAMKSVRDTEAVEGAVRQLEALSSRVGAEVDRHPLLAGPRDAIVAATAEVKASLQHLRSAPITEMPAVAVLESLHLARTAIGTVTTTVLAALPSPLAHTITAVRDRASSAVHEATGVFHTVAHPLTGAASSITHGITGSVVDAAASIAATGVDFALRQAALIDSSLKLTDKAVSIDHEWRITDKAKAGLTTGLGLAQSVDQRLGLVQTAQGMDARILGGRGTALVNQAYALAVTQALPYVKSQLDKYNEIRAGKDQPQHDGSDPVHEGDDGAGAGSGGADRQGQPPQPSQLGHDGAAAKQQQQPRRDASVSSQGSGGGGGRRKQQQQQAHSGVQSVQKAV